MTEALKRHGIRVALASTAMLAATALYGAIVYLVPLPATPPIAQADHLLWVFAVLTALNLVTLSPVQRAMLAGPLRVYTVSQDPGGLLRAHLTSQLVVFARLEAIAIFGVVLYFLTGRRDWFWGFVAVAVIGMVLLWPTQSRLKATLGIS